MPPSELARRMTRHDLAQILAYAEISDPKSALNQKWKDEEALSIAASFGS